jgi:hypothetical protein
MKIIGAGMAGLLAANMLRRHNPVVYEQRETLPDNHAAVLRFRNEGVSRATGIPFKKVKVQKAIIDERGAIHTTTNLRLSNMYAQKVIGRVVTRSIINLDPEERFIAPQDFIQQMAQCVDIVFNSAIDLSQEENSSEPVISTMPMPVLMTQLGWDSMPVFGSSPIWVVTAEILDPIVDVYQTLYFPDPDLPLYRASITGNKVILEFMKDPEGTSCGSLADEWLTAFGIQPRVLANEKISVQRYGKISPINDLLRKNFIFTASQQHHIYSLGRFATWRQILLDDLVNDIQFIESFITQRDLYHAQKSIVLNS